MTICTVAESREPSLVLMQYCPEALHCVWNINVAYAGSFACSTHAASDDLICGQFEVWSGS